MLDIKGLTRRFGSKTAVDKITFSVAKGEVVGFLGPNGAGKSTSMRMIAGVLEPDEGDVLLDGHSIVSNRRDAQASLGYLPEGAPLYLDMTPPEFLRFVGSARGMEKSALGGAVDRVTADARIHSVSSQTIRSLSKGYRRRVGLAAALIHDPPVLILDEPTDGLDPNQKRAVRALIARMAPQKAIVISTHTLEEVPAMCSRAIVVDQGRMIADETPEGLAALATDGGGLEAAFRDLTDQSVEAAA